MQFKNFTALAITLLPSLIAAMPSNVTTRQNPPREVSCDTSDASPYVTDSEIALRIIREKGDIMCSNPQTGGSDCTEMQRWESSLITICGDLDLTLPCTDVVYYLEQILGNCVANGKVGGSYQIGGGGGWNRVQFQHT